MKKTELLIYTTTRQTLKWWHWVEESNLRKRLYCMSLCIWNSRKCKLIHGDGRQMAGCLAEGWERWACLLSWWWWWVRVISICQHLQIAHFKHVPLFFLGGGANIWTDDHVGEGAGFLNMLFCTRCLRSQASGRENVHCYDVARKYYIAFKKHTWPWVQV